MKVQIKTFSSKSVREKPCKNCLDSTIKSNQQSNQDALRMGCGSNMCFMALTPAIL